ncbi:hypothetical protein E8E12_005273 [Didymella heteroderae]|uniref:Glycosyltransferase family 28 N-terminal domain-containing protein n=1 Tax=Didymella heteroderae TaxID=1769908 RepID=A0A9P5C2N6_9PLEO|nr:hypothetical protein E8E12_005273 [Didymella heteroderae]
METSTGRFTVTEKAWTPMHTLPTMAIFTPTLDQHLHNAKDRPYISPLKVSPPHLNIVMHVVGSRGDVQPFVALGKVLKDTYGHRVRLATHPNFKSFVQEQGLEFFSIGGDPTRLMAFMVKNPSLRPSAFPHPLANIQSSNADAQLSNYISYAMIELLSWQALGDIINRFRAKCLGLDPVSTIWGPGMLQRLKVPHTYCWSPALIPKPTDWGSQVSVSGFCFLNAPDYTPASDLLEYLNNGPAPVYIGFGSIVLDDPNAMTQLIFETANRTRQRVLLSKGWGGMGADELCVPDDVFMLGNVPHDWLFSKIKLGAFAAYTLADAHILDLQDMKLFRPREHYVDEGPWDPVSGGFTAFVGAFTGMSKGLYDVPSETWRAMQMPLAGPSKVRPRNNQDTASSGSPAADDSRDMLRPSGFHVSKGAGRFVRALVQGPVNISVNLTRGMHNIPKLWGDDTVRPQERVSDLKTGVKAVGREFGFGFHDAITGLVTQPIKGARERGAGGFVTGLGKGVGGFLPKMGAACLGILSHTLQGASKEVQKLFGNDVQSYIVASRATQGYEEWLHGSEAEKREVITKWKLNQKALKGKGKVDGLIQDDAGEQDQNLEKRLDQKDGEGPAEQAQPANRSDDHFQDLDCPVTATDGSNLSLHNIEIIDTTPRGALSVGSVSQVPQPPRSLDSRHPAGVTRHVFEAKNDEGRTEKTAEEKIEEEIVIEYVRRQSLLEAQHCMNGKGSGRVIEDEEDRDLQRALRTSLREQGESAGRM